MRLIADERFEAYGTSHLTVLAIFVIGAVLVVLAGRRLRSGCAWATNRARLHQLEVAGGAGAHGFSPARGRRARFVAPGGDAETRFRRGFAAAVLAVTVPLQILQLLPGEWNLQTSLPFQLCDLAWMFAVHALWTGNRLTSTITYLWGVTLTTQGMLTPDLASEFPEARFLMFWGMHLLIVWASLFLVLGLGILPTWRTYRQTFLITLAWAVSAFVFNLAAGTNYGYLNRLPQNASLLDHLGPWPLFVVLEIAIIATVWALLTWPWVRVRHRREVLP